MINDSGGELQLYSNFNYEAQTLSSESGLYLSPVLFIPLILALFSAREGYMNLLI